MNQWKVKLSPKSASEIRNIYNYIASTLLVPEIAEKQTLRILNAISDLKDMPKKFPLFNKEPWRSRGLRKCIVDNFVILYLTNDKTNEVLVYQVFYGGQNIENIINND